MGGRVTTHVLNTARGRPGANIRIDVCRIEGEATILVGTHRTNGDGRTDQPVLSGAAMAAGTFELRFHIGAYFKGLGEESPFLDLVPIRFTVADASQHYHVPLLASPWSYSTYRGS